jgi:hypothetical protein
MNLRFFAALALLDAPWPGVLVGFSYGVLAVAGIFLSLGIFFLGRWIWRRAKGQPFEPAPGDAVSFLRKAFVFGSIVWLLLVALDAERYSRRKEGLESSAVDELRTINTAEVTYLFSNAGHYGSIPELITQGLLDARFAQSIPGYDFNVTASGTSYTATATPGPAGADSFGERLYKFVDRRIPGDPRPKARHGFYSGPDAVIRYATTTSATCNPCFPEGLSGAPIE